MSAALGQISTALGVGDQQSLEVLAIRIIELARRGDRDAERLKERVLQTHSDETSNVIPLAPGIAISEARFVAVGAQAVCLFGSPAGHSRHLHPRLRGCAGASRWRGE